MLRFLIRISANLVIPAYFKLTSNNKYRITGKAEEGGRLIISLTSFPKRIGNLWLVIETLLRQTKAPDKIVLWLSANQFSSLNDLPKRLLQLQHRGLEIKLMPDDLRSHKKYYYAFTEFPDDDIVLVDDDIFYRSTMVEDLQKHIADNPDCVIAQFGKTMLWENGKLQPYVSWPLVTTATEPRMDTFFGTGGGVLIKPSLLHKDTLNAELFSQMAATADDVWINAMCRMQGIPVVKTEYYSYHLPVLSANNSTLFDVNLSLNDSTIKSVSEYYLNSGNADPFSIRPVSEPLQKNE